MQKAMAHRRNKAMSNQKTDEDPQRALARFSPLEIATRNKMGFNAVVADRAPGTGRAYVRMEVLVPWPEGVTQDTIHTQDGTIREAAATMAKAMDHAVNGLRRDNEKFVVEAPVSHGLEEKSETNMSLFVYAQQDDQYTTPETIKEFLLANQKQIAARLKDYLTQQQSQKIS